MKLHRTIHAKLVLDRKGKHESVVREYWAWQREVGGEDEQLHSVTKQQAERFRQRIKKQNGYGAKLGEYPLILRRDSVKVQHHKNSRYAWWIRIPLFPRSKWVPILFPYEQEELLRHSIRECKLVRNHEKWFVNITVRKQSHIKRDYDAILPIDMGVRKLATTIEGDKPRFYGKEVRRTRGNYFRLRRSVGKGIVISKWKHKERDTVKHQVHTITRRIVDRAKQMNAIIAIGDLSGISKGNRGRRFNRRLGTQPFHLFRQYLTYKANWEGIRVIEVSEAWTSQTCHNCGIRGQRVAGTFKCQNCGLVTDADVNAAHNIMKRAYGMIRETRAVLTQPANSGQVRAIEAPLETRESSDCGPGECQF